MNNEAETEPKESALTAFHKDRKGAVLVEFLIAIMPLMIVFTTFVQVAEIANADMVANHATVVAARAAAVISNAHKNTPDAKAGENKDQIIEAYELALGPWKKTMGIPTIEITDESSKGDNFGFVTVKSTVTYTCSVPFGSRLICGVTNGTHTITRTSKFPHQGACYKDLEGGGC